MDLRNAHCAARHPRNAQRGFIESHNGLRRNRDETLSYAD